MFVPGRRVEFTATRSRSIKRRLFETLAAGSRTIISEPVCASGTVAKGHRALLNCATTQAGLCGGSLQSGQSTGQPRRKPASGHRTLSRSDQQSPRLCRGLQQLGRRVHETRKRAGRDRSIRTGQAMQSLFCRRVQQPRFCVFETRCMARALDEFHACLKVDPESPHGHKGLADALARANQLEDAIPLYEKVLAKHPNSPDAQNNLVFRARQVGTRKRSDRAFCSAAQNGEEGPGRNDRRLCQPDPLQPGGSQPGRRSPSPRKPRGFAQTPRQPPLAGGFGTWLSEAPADQVREERSWSRGGSGSDECHP